MFIIFQRDLHLVNWKVTHRHSLLQILKSRFGLDVPERDAIERVVVMNTIKKQPVIEYYPKVVNVKLARDSTKVVQLNVGDESIGSFPPLLFLLM